MPLDFKQKETEEVDLHPQAANGTDVIEVPKFDITSDRARLSDALANSEEVDAIVSQIQVYDIDSITSFGAEATENISKSSDEVLRSVNMGQLDDTNAMLNTLTKIMSKFDLEEIQEEPKGFKKLFSNARKQLDKLLEKYTTMGSEVDKIYVQLKQHESEIKKSNQTLKTMFESNVSYYHQLVKYILAGEQAQAELRDYIAQKQSELESSGDQSIQLDISTLQQSLDVLERRTEDLRAAEVVAMQSVPMLNMMQRSNAHLILKINSAFITSLPAFKQAVAQAVMLKKQRIQAEALAALDEKTNEILIKNAQNVANQSRMSAQLASGSSIKTETLEKTWQIIMDGIKDTKTIEEEARKQREQDKQRLEKLKTEYQTASQKY